MFNIFPSVYVIVALYFTAMYFYSRFDFWLKVAFDAVGYDGKVASRYSRRNLVLFGIFLVLALLLTVVDFVNANYLIE